MPIHKLLASFTLIALGSLAPLHTQEEAILKKTSQDFIGVGKIAIPAVVSIQAKSKSTGNFSGFFEYDPQLEMFQDDFFGRFFGSPRKGPSPERFQISQGSGFLVSADGYILTNNHVVKNSNEINIKLNDGREFQGKIIGADEATDVALLKIEADNLPFLKLGNSDALQVGQWVVAIGNPLGLQASLTVGVASAKGRSNLDIARIEDFIQTDAAINRGNSGGPLLDLDGEVIGINTAIATNYGNGGYLGIGFAIPSNMARHVMEQLIATGSVSRGYIGLILQEVDSDLAQAFGLQKVEGAIVAEVLKDSPAEKAGIKQGDIILKFNQSQVDQYSALRNFIALQKPGTRVTLTIQREGKPLEISLEVGSFKDHNRDVLSLNGETPKLGLEVETLTPDLAKSLNLNDFSGVIVTKVHPGSAAAFVGLKKGALILAVNNQKVNSKQEYEAELRATPTDKPVLFLVKQGEALRYVSIRFETPKPK